MKIPKIKGIIERRILANYTVNPEYIEKILPPPFKPKLYKGKAIAGICLIRLKNIKPQGFPNFLGLNSENGAHRIAVEWQENGITQEGVYIIRRDTSLKINYLLGGRIFPGIHHQAKFKLNEKKGDYHISFKSSDQLYMELKAQLSSELNKDSIFENLETLSSFFEKGSIGYSPKGTNYEGLELKTYSWDVKPLDVVHIHSDYFDDPSCFPGDSIRFDNAILMENIEHEWNSLGKLTAHTTKL